MNTLIITLALLTNQLTQLQTSLQTPIAYADEQPIHEVWDKDAIIAYIKEKSTEYKVDPIVPIVIVQQESGYNTQARGDNGLARGLAQIRKDFHPEVTDEEADNPKFSVDFLVQNLAKGHTSWWSTYPLK